MARWRESGHTDIFHHAFGEHRRLGYDLFADAAQYDSFAVDAGPPTLVFRGRADEAVDPRMVERFAAGRAGVTLRLLDDGHQLHDSLETIWRELTGFLGLAARGKSLG